MKFLITMLCINLFIFIYMVVDTHSLGFEFKKHYPNRKNKYKKSYIVVFLGYIKLFLQCNIPIWNLLMILCTFTRAYQERVFEMLLEETEEK